MKDQPSLVIRNGLIADGLGGELFVSDIAIVNGVIAAIGKDLPRYEGAEDIDADGKLVTPGYIDLHTHYDGQAVWSDNFAPSSAHGVTTVIMGNCGVGFAPCRPAEHDMLVSIMEGVEDIPEVVLTKGLDWSWETFPEYLNTIESRPHDVDFAAYLPHSPLRVYVMGARGAAREAATADDLAKMEEVAFEALQAGALGFATSSIVAHRKRDGDFIPSYQAQEAEYQAIARALKRAGGKLFQVTLEQRRPVETEEYFPMMTRVSRTTGGTLMFSLGQHASHPDAWRRALTALEEANALDGVSIRPQVFPRPVGMLLGHEVTLNPFCFCPSYQPLRDLPLAERIAALRTPEMRGRLLSEESMDPTNPVYGVVRDFERHYRFVSANYEPPIADNLAEVARRTGRPALEIAYDWLLENDGKAMILATLLNYSSGTLAEVREMITNEHTVLGLGDGGAHYGLVCDASFPTFMLTHWARDRAEGRLSVSEVVRQLTSEPANLIGLRDRGVLAPGYKADINIIDHEKLTLLLPGVKYDLPGGGRRLDQGAEGYLATIVSGSVIRRNGKPTGALPGRLVRGGRAQPAATAAAAE